eukprot:112886-Chlamydomonas_euryale.AAC.1
MRDPSPMRLMRGKTSGGDKSERASAWAARGKGRGDQSASAAPRSLGRTTVSAAGRPRSQPRVRRAISKRKQRGARDSRGQLQPLRQPLDAGAEEALTRNQHDREHQSKPADLEAER